MISAIVRLIPLLIITSIIVYKLKKSKITKKKFFIKLTPVIGFLLLIVALFFPVENLLVNFDSPQAVFRYWYGFSKINNIIYGKDSAWVFYSSNGIMFVPKTENGYKIPNIFTYKRELGGSDGFAYVVHHISGTNDYYLFVSSVIEGDIVYILDKESKDIRAKAEKSKTTKIRDVEWSYFYVYVEGFSESDEVIIVKEGNEIELE